MHTWDKSGHRTEATKGTLQDLENARVAGVKRNRNSSTLVTEVGRNIEYQIGIDEIVQIIPVEDIISIKLSSVIKKEIQQTETTRLKTPPPENRSCWQRVKNCLIRVFCFWKRRRQVLPIPVTTKTAARQATHKILMTIQHTRFSLIDTTSVVRVLPSNKQAEFYQNHFAVDTLQFYYWHNSTFDGQEHSEQMLASEALTRFVMQLKAMVGHYPDQEQLALIFQQQPVQLLGNQLTTNEVNMVGTYDVRDIVIPSATITLF